MMLNNNAAIAKRVSIGTGNQSPRSDEAVGDGRPKVLHFDGLQGLVVHGRHQIAVAVARSASARMTIASQTVPAVAHLMPRRRQNEQLRRLINVVHRLLEQKNMNITGFKCAKKDQ